MSGQWSSVYDPEAERADQVVQLLWAALEPASHTATMRRNSPAWRVVLKAARVDSPTGTGRRVAGLASGIAYALGELISDMAHHQNLDPETVATGLAQQFREDKRPSGIPDLLENLFTNRLLEALVGIYHRDPEEFLVTIVDAAEFASLLVLGIAHIDDQPVTHIDHAATEAILERTRTTIQFIDALDDEDEDQED